MRLVAREKLFRKLIATEAGGKFRSISQFK